MEKEKPIIIIDKVFASIKRNALSSFENELTLPIPKDIDRGYTLETYMAKGHYFDPQIEKKVSTQFHYANVQFPINGLTGPQSLIPCKDIIVNLHATDIVPILWIDIQEKRHWNDLEQLLHADCLDETRCLVVTGEDRNGRPITDTSLLFQEAFAKRGFREGTERLVLKEGSDFSMSGDDTPGIEGSHAIKVELLYFVEECNVINHA